MTGRSAHCCLCGEARRPTQAPVESFGNDQRVLVMKDYRPMQDGRWEESPQMIVSVSMWRNGGTAPGQTHICDGCILVGLRHAKQFVDQSIAAINALAPRLEEAEKLLREAGDEMRSELSAKGIYGTPRKMARGHDTPSRITAFLKQGEAS